MKKTLLLLASVLLTLPMFAQNDFNRHNFSMNAGYAFKFADNHPEQFTNMVINSDHAKKMKHGYNFDFAYDYRFHQWLSVGFEASMFGAVHGFDSLMPSPSGTENQVYCTDDMNIFYVGPSFKVQLPTIAERFDIWARVTAGYMNMRITDKSNVSNTYSGNSFGYGIGCGLDYAFNEYIGMGFTASFLQGSVSTLKLGEDKIDISENKESLGRINFTIGVRIRL
ncbi:MAG: outer membrane beta-barrel protein [Candidatus Onthomorpha sp.]